MEAHEIADAAIAVPPDVPALFAAVADIGPYFAVATGPEPDGGGWVSLRDLVRRPDGPLSARMTIVREVLGTDSRVAASTAFQGLAAQLVAPLFAAVAVRGALPSVDGTAAEAGAGDRHDAERRPAVLAEGVPTASRGDEANGLADALHWRPSGAGPWLWWPGSGGRVVPCSDAGALVEVLFGLLGPLVAAVRVAAPVSGRVLWGNVAAAVASARRLVAADRPDAAGRATDVAERLLASPPLAATTAFRPPEPPDLRWTFRRRSCCLYYRVPGSGLCGDCVLQGRRRRGA